MEASFKPKSNELTIALTGDLIGGANAMSFAQSLREAIAASGGLRKVEIDARGVGFVNSSGLGMLLSARQAAKEAGADLSIRNPQPQLKSLLEVTKLSEILGAVS